MQLEPERRVPPAELPVEGLAAFIAFRSDERSAQRGEAFFDLSPRPLGAVTGALAGSSRLLEPKGLSREPLGPFEKRGAFIGVTPHDGGRPRAERGVCRTLYAAWFSEETTQRASGEARKRPWPGYTERR